MSDKILPFSKVATTPANGEPVPAKVELLLADSFGDPETLLNSRDWLVMDPHDAQAAAVRHNNALVRGTYKEGYSAGKAEGIKEGLRRAAAMAGTMAERPFDSEPEFSAVLAVEAAILKEAGE